jgi:GAF domain-containing protein
VPQAHFPPELLNSLRALEEILPLQEDLETTMARIAEVSVRLVDGCDSASASVLEDGEVRTPGASDQLAIELDLVQYQTGAGPCLDAVTNGRILVVDDMKAESRWPAFCESALRHGIVSSMSLPLRIDGVTGSLNLYGRSQRGFREVASELIELLSNSASIALENSKVYAASKRLIDQLNEAIKSRELIGEAKGILMARERLSEDGAFEMLVRASQTTNTKLREIAQKIVDEATS